MNDKKLVTLVIIYNNINELNNADKYIKKQTFNNYIETIYLNNTNNKYASAAYAYNYATSIANGDVLIFMHQDVELIDNKIIENYYDYLIKNKNNIVGAAGIAKLDNKVHSNIILGINKDKFNHLVIDEEMEAITLDECFFALTKKRCQELKFDEKTCYGWHLYAADICYENILNKGNNYIYSTNLYHKSKGNKDINFEITIGKMIKKYNGKLQKIITPCINIKCTYFSYIKYKFNQLKIKIATAIFG